WKLSFLSDGSDIRTHGTRSLILDIQKTFHTEFSGGSPHRYYRCTISEDGNTAFPDHNVRLRRHSRQTECPDVRGQYDLKYNIILKHTDDKSLPVYPALPHETMPR